MNPTVSIFVAATPLLASSGAEAARGTGGGSTNLDAAAHSPSQHSSTPYQPYRRRVHRPGVGGPASRSRIFHLRSLRSAAIAQ
jgi:hypothetical protein